MISAATLSLVLTLLQDAPELYDTVKQDISDLSAGTVTEADLTTRWTAMQTAWTAAKAKWAAA